MNYKELQAVLKAIKLRGLTDIKLNSSKEILQAEYDRTKDLKTLRESLADRVANGEVLYPVTEEVEVTEVIYKNAINHVLTSVFNSNHKVTTKEILNSIHIKISDFIGNLTATLGIKTKAFLESLEDHLTAKYRRSESYLYNNSVIKSLVRHLTETVIYSN